MPGVLRRGGRHRVIAGLPRRAQHDIDAIERTRLWPGAVAEAVTVWRAFVRGGPRRICPDADCVCQSPAEARQTLETAAAGLPADSARALRRVFAAADAEFLARTLPDPFTPAGWPWWLRRYHSLS